MPPSLDRSNGYEAHAAWWRSRPRHPLRARVVLAWAAHFPPRAALLDLGCGDGYPISVALAEAGFDMHGIDASPSMIGGFRHNLPHAQAECAPAEESQFFHRAFDGIFSWGLLFLLEPDVQRTVIARVAQALHPGGRFLFTSPSQICAWDDALTGRRSVSLGRDEYTRVLAAHGLTLVAGAVDEGQNFYYMAQKV